MKPNLDQVIEILKKEGLNDEQIASFIQTLTQNFAQHLYILITDQLKEEDLISLNKIEDNVERERIMSEIFEKNTGQNLKNLADEFVKKYAEEFLEGYKSLNNSSATA